MIKNTSTEWETESYSREAEVTCEAVSVGPYSIFWEHGGRGVFWEEKLTDFSGIY